MLFCLHVTDTWFIQKVLTSAASLTANHSFLLCFQTEIGDGYTELVCFTTNPLLSYLKLTSSSTGSSGNTLSYWHMLAVVLLTGDSLVSADKACMLGDEPTELVCSVLDLLRMFKWTTVLLTLDSLVSGDKPYIMGGEPTELDCSVVGMLSAFKWAVNPNNPVRKMIEGMTITWLS